MPNPRYQPNDPRYYENPDFDYYSLSAILGCTTPADPDELEAFNSSEENMRAYLRSRLPSQAREKVITPDLCRLNPAHSTQGLDRAQRRALTRQTQDAFLDVAIRRHNAHLGVDVQDRVLLSLFRLQDSTQPTEENLQIRNAIAAGDPNVLGQLFEQRIAQADQFFKINYATKDDSFLLENFEQIHLSHDIVTNAQNILAAHNSKLINLSDKTLQTLQNMQKLAPKMDVPLQRLRMVANPMYEFADYRQLDHTSYGRFIKLDTMLPDMDPVMRDYLQWYNVNREFDCIVGETELWEKMAQDYPTGREKLQVRFLNDESQLTSIPFNNDPMKAFIGKALTNSPIVVTDSQGNVNCYRYEDGKIRSVSAARVRNQFVDDLREGVVGLVNMLDQANRGLFIGSQQYRNVRSDMKQLKALAFSLDDPPQKEQLDALSAMLAATAATCQSYMDTKNLNNLGTVRTARRYHAVETAYDLCMRGLQMYQLQDHAVQSELQSIMNYTNPNAHRIGHRLSYPSYNLDDVIVKIHSSYGKNPYMDANNNPVNPRLPDSDAGNIASDLQQSIHRSLNEVALLRENFDPDDARNIMSNMVVLEMVKAGRSVSEDGNILAGPIERALALNPGKLIQTVRDSAIFQSMTEDVSRDMLHHFIMTDGAKNLSQVLTRTAVLQASGNPSVKAPHLENSLDIPAPNPNELGGPIGGH